MQVRVGTYSRWLLTQHWPLIKFSPFSSTKQTRKITTTLENFILDSIYDVLLGGGEEHSCSAGRLLTFLAIRWALIQDCALVNLLAHQSGDLFEVDACSGLGA